MIKVLVVEDSAVIRDFLVHVLGSDPELQVVGTAPDGEAALAAVKRHRPDVVTMDIHMPRLDGLQATRRLMETDPLPIVIVSGSRDSDEVATTFAAMEAGALAVLGRPAGIGHADHAAQAAEMVRTVKLMAGVRVVRRRAYREPRTPAAEIPPRPTPRTIEIVGLGASTGGPPVLQTILAALPRTFPVPIVIVQHMAVGFTRGFADWLGQTSALAVGVAVHGEALRPGHVYLAPDHRHLRVTSRRTIALDDGAAENGLRPSVSRLFRSLAESYRGAALVGLLSGMGRDGAEELRLLKEAGATTFVQDKESAVVHGMAGRAMELDAAMLVLPPERIAGMLHTLTADARRPAP